MIIHTGMRTDIPAFYAPWLINRIREGYVLVRNPFDVHAVTRYSLSPDVVDLLVFCTKNPAPLLPHRETLDAYGQYWFVTITPYGRDVEPNVPPKEQVMDDFLRLSERAGSRCMAWRYDPILLHGPYDLSFHLETFERMARRLHAPKIRSNRRECACHLSGDIGAYNTCGHLCRYCYANTDASAVRACMQQHDPHSPFLVGHALPGDRIHQADQISWLDNQISMFEL